MGCPAVAGTKDFPIFEKVDELFVVFVNVAMLSVVYFTTSA
jgi:hypothetical protein